MDKKEVLFRASGSGNLMTNKKGSVITENELDELEKLEQKKNLFTLGELPPRQKWTPNMDDRLKELSYKKSKPIELSDTAKSFVKEAWLLNKKGFYEDIDNKYTGKGEFNEDESITMITELDGVFYKKNEERITKGHLTGECDIVSVINGEKIIQDVKSSWNAKTFMNAKMTKLYEWQLRIYMYLYDADKAKLRYCLTDCPEHLYEYEKYRLRQRYNIIDDESIEVKPLFDQLKRNFFYTNELYTLEEKVKTYEIERDDDIFQKLMDRIPTAVEYYNNLKLNIKE